jgi:hypothetical protein
MNQRSPLLTREDANRSHGRPGSGVQICRPSAAVSPSPDQKSKLAEAIRYALSRWEGLTRFIDWYYEKISAEDDVRKLSGVRGVTNKIAIRPPVDSTNVKSKIESALKRMQRLKRMRSELPCKTATRWFWKAKSIIGTNAARSKTRHGQLQGSHLSKTA